MKTASVLVVEDEGIIARDIQVTLEKMGYSVPAIAATADEAVAKAVELNPDLILMDIILSNGPDGISAAERVHQQMQIPVVYLTAHSDSATLQKAKFTEPYGYIVKPVVERDLRISIEMALHRHRMDQRRAELEHWFATTLASIGEAVIATDRDGRVRFMNSSAEKLTGWLQTNAINHHIEEVLILSDAYTSHSQGLFGETLQKGLVVHWTGHAWLYPRSGLGMPVDFTSTRIRREDGVVAGVVVIFRDISSRRQLEEDRERLISDLRSALENIKTLRALLPICASCKRVRDDEGYWEQLDAYITNHSIVQFTHGVCPDCLRKLYPDISEEQIIKLNKERLPDSSPPV